MKSSLYRVFKLSLYQPEVIKQETIAMKRSTVLFHIISLLCLSCFCIPTESQTVIYDSSGATSRVVQTGVVGVDLSSNTAPTPTGGSYVEGGFDVAKFFQPQAASLVKGTNVMLVADTKNQVIRKVDLGNKVVSHVAGLPLEQGADDGVGTLATFSMPYSVEMHAKQKYAFVADYNNLAIRTINTFTSEVKTVLAGGFGKPTDIVSWGQNMALCDGFNHTVWIYSGIDTGMLDQAASADNQWPRTQETFRLLSGTFAPEVGRYVEGNSSTARFQVPLGITYDSTRDVLYVADFENRVIREVNIITGHTTLRVGTNLQGPNIVDNTTNALQGVLFGPTSVYYHKSTDSVYFSDRNVDEYGGALRVWNVGENSLLTVVGQVTRKSGDGLITSSTVGASAIWGVVVSQDGWMGWTESDTHSIRLVSGGGSEGKVLPCPDGEWYNETSLSCMLCTNEIPLGTVYIGSGTPNGGGGDCPWQCPDPPATYLPYKCPYSDSSIANGSLAVDEWGNWTVVCAVGMERDESTCQTCTQNFFCTGYSAIAQECMANSTSPAGTPQYSASHLPRPNILPHPTMFPRPNGSYACGKGPFHERCPQPVDFPVLCPDAPVFCAVLAGLCYLYSRLHSLSKPFPVLLLVEDALQCLDHIVTQVKLMHHG